MYTVPPPLIPTPLTLKLSLTSVFFYCGIGLRIGRLHQFFQCQAVGNNSGRLAGGWTKNMGGGRGEKVSLWPE